MYFAAREKGKGLAEYAFILVLVVLVVLLLLTLFGTSVGTLYSNVIEQI